MELKFIISHTANFLFFAQKTNENIEGYLSDYNTDPLFYSENTAEIYSEIKKVLGEQKSIEFKKALSFLKDEFNSEWREMSKKLFLWKQYFKSNNLLLWEIVRNFKKISGVKKFAFSKIPIYLISDSVSNDKDINAWFSWMPQKSFVVVEIPFKCMASKNFFSTGILVHELFHLMLRENKNLISQIKKVSEENSKFIKNATNEYISEKMFLEELLISSFIPEGYFSEKYLNIKVFNYALKPKTLLLWRKLVAFKMKNTVKEYINNNRQIDKNFLQQIIKIIKQNIK